MKKSKLGYKRDSPDVNNPYNIIPSGRITMKDVDFPVYGIDEYGNSQMMYPGGEYQFPGNEVLEIPEFGSGGLKQWFDEKWVDVKTGKECGRSGKDKDGRPYPACRPSRRVNSTTPKTTSEMSPSEKAKFKREKTSGQRINYNHKRAQAGLEIPQPYIRPDFFSPQQIQAAEQRLQQDRTAAARAYATPATGRIEGEGLIDAVLPVVAAPMVKAVAKPLANLAADLGQGAIRQFSGAVQKAAIGNVDKVVSDLAATRYNQMFKYKGSVHNKSKNLPYYRSNPIVLDRNIKIPTEKGSPFTLKEEPVFYRATTPEKFEEIMNPISTVGDPRKHAQNLRFFTPDQKIAQRYMNDGYGNLAVSARMDIKKPYFQPRSVLTNNYVQNVIDQGYDAIVTPGVTKKLRDAYEIIPLNKQLLYNIQKFEKFQQGGQMSASAGYDSWYNSPIAAGRYTFNPKDPAEYYVEGYGTKQGPGIAAGMDYTNPKYRTQAMLRAGLDPEIGASLRAQGGYRFNPIDNRREQLTWGPYGGVRFQTEDYQQGVSSELGYNNLQTDLAYGVNARYNKALANRGRFSVEGDLGMATGQRPEGNLGEGFDPRFYGAVKATYSPPMYKNTRNRKPGPTTYSSGYQMGGSMTPQGLSPAFFTGMKDAAVDAFKTFMASPDASVPEQFDNVSAPVDWRKLSRPEQIKYGIDQVTALEAEANRKPLENLLEATAYMENRYGEDPRAYGRKYTSSFMSIDPIALQDMFTGRGAEGRYNSAQQRQFENFKKLNLPTDQKEFNALLTEDDPVAAMAAARYRYALVPQALPDMNNPEAMFDYWLKNYNGNGVLKHQSRAQAFKDFQKAYKRALSND